MILPSKHISQHRALLSIGAVVLNHLTDSKTVSALWEEMLQTEALSTVRALHYTTFVLTLDLLFLFGAIDLRDGLISRRTK